MSRCPRCAPTVEDGPQTTRSRAIEIGFLEHPDLGEFKTFLRPCYREFIDGYCSEPRLAFNWTVVTRYRIALEQHPYVPSTTNLGLAAIRRPAYGASDYLLLTWPISSRPVSG